MSGLIAVKVEILPSTPEQVARVVETLSNVLTGFAMDAIESDITLHPYEFTEPDDDEEPDLD